MNEREYMITSKDKILTIIQNRKTELSSFGVSRIGLFGSCVRNEQTSCSDIDILVDFFLEKENYDNYMALILNYANNAFKI